MKQGNQSRPRPRKKSGYDKVLWEPGNMLYPVPVVMVGCGRMEKERNIITVGWCGTVSTNPPMLTIAVKPERHSYGLIKKTGEFSINLTTRDLAFATDWCGVVSGRDKDKFKEMHLTPVRGTKIGAPLIAQSPVNLECKVTEMTKPGSHHVFTAEVVAVHAAKKYLDGGTGYFDLAAAEPICYSHGGYYQLGKKLGTFGYSVKKKIKNRKTRAERRRYGSTS